MQVLTRLQGVGKALRPVLCPVRSSAPPPKPVQVHTAVDLHAHGEWALANVPCCPQPLFRNVTFGKAGNPGSSAGLLTVSRFGTIALKCAA